MAKCNQLIHLPLKGLRDFLQEVEFTKVGMDEMTDVVHGPHHLNALQIQLSRLTAVQRRVF